MKLSICPDSIDTVERIYRPTREDFNKNFFFPQKPCVITGAMDKWKALSLWSTDYLKSALGSKRVLCHVSSSNYFEDFLNIENIDFSVFFDWLMSPDFSNLFVSDKFAKKYFLSSLEIQSYCPQLLEDIELPEYFNHTLLASLNLWIGRGSNRVRLHYDSFHNLYAQVVGKKRWLIFSPEQSSLLYAYPWYTSLYWCSQVNVNQPDLKRFPKFCEAKPLEVITEPGELLFLPAGWWHSPIGIGLNVAVNFWWLVGLRDITSTRWSLQSALRHLIAKNICTMLTPFIRVKHRLFSKA